MAIKVSPEFMEVFRKVARANGEEEPQCFVCMKPIAVGDDLSSKFAESVKVSVAVHDHCVENPFQRDPTLEEIETCRRVFREERERLRGWDWRTSFPAGDSRRFS